MEQRSTWGVASSTNSLPGKTKIPPVALQRSSDKMTDSQKEGVRVWNLMVKTLLENGLMEER